MLGSRPAGSAVAPAPPAPETLPPPFARPDPTLSAPTPVYFSRPPSPLPEAVPAPPPPPTSRPGPMLAPLTPAYLPRPPSPLPEAGLVRRSDREPVASRPVANPAETPVARPSQPIASGRSALTTALGFVTAAGLSLFAIAGLVLVMIAAPAGLDLLQHSDPAGAWDNLGQHAQSNLIVAAAATGALGATSLLLFSILVGRSTRSAPGLGAEVPMLSPLGAGICWLGAIWWQFQIGVALVTPVVLVWLRWPIPGLILALVAIKIAQRRPQEPLGWVLAPARHVPDLYYRLGPAGSVDSSLAWLWSICYRGAHGLVLIAWVLPATALVAAFASAWMGYGSAIPGWQMDSLGPAQLAVAILAAGLVATIFGSVILLVPLSIGLVRRQAKCRRLGRAGRTGPRAVEMGRAGPQPAPMARDRPLITSADSAFQRHDEQPAWTRAGFADPEDRIVERYPRAVGFDDSVPPLRYEGGLRG